ncbi:MAG: hypothetical protein NTX45_27915 [Proteobacteria bacterium]|nr:hypothetical protein [Pseudomonadota bacterium]
MKELYSTIEQIEARWFRPSDDLLARLAHADQTVPPALRQAVTSDAAAMQCIDALKINGPLEAIEDMEPLNPPAWMLEMVERRVNAQRQLANATIPCQGQILTVERLLTPDGELEMDIPAPLSVLLDGRGDTEGVWYGWYTAPEVAYASVWDYVLQEEDGPFDPGLAGMVQLWNPVYFYMTPAVRVIGQIVPERLQAIRALAAEYVSRALGDNRETSRPGFIGMRETLQGHSVVTGTPLGGEDDPRRRYQQIYHAVADAVREPARLALASRPWWAVWWESIAASLQFEPSPAIALAMDGTSTDETSEGILAGRFRLRMDSSNENVIRLHLSRVGGEGGAVRLTRLGQTLQTFAPSQAETVLSLDQRPGYALEILGDDGSLIERIELDEPEE